MAIENTHKYAQIQPQDDNKRDRQKLISFTPFHKSPYKYVQRKNDLNVFVSFKNIDLQSIAVK